MEDEVVQTSILLCAESDKDNTTESYGSDCTAQFLECLESLAVDLVSLCFLPFTLANFPSTLGIKEATELMQGWQGTRSNQSVKAYKWLAWQEHLLRRDFPSSSNDEPQADRIRHAGSGGE